MNSPYEDDGLMGSGHTTPTATGPSENQPLPRLSSTNLARTTVHDTAVDVVIAPLARGPGRQIHKPEGKSASYRSALHASCIISLWNIDETQYYTLTFTSATATEPAHRSARTSSRVVNRTSAAAHLTKSHSTGSSSSSGRRTGTSSKVATPTLQQPEFPPRGPPIKSKTDITVSASIFQKATQLKDAILSSINMPSYGT